MKITCPNCGTEGNIDENKVPESGIWAICSKCKNRFRINKKLAEQNQDDIMDGVLLCPKCGVKQEKSDSCKSCGVIFHKIKKATLATKEIKQYLPLDTIRDVYNNVRSNLAIPSDCTTVVYKSGPLCLLKGSNYVWIADERIHFFPSTYVSYRPAYNSDCSVNESTNIVEQIDDIGKIRLTTIPLCDVLSYGIEGEVFREQKITGGGGGGSSIGKAIVGGIIAGVAGAIVASRNDIDEVRSELITHDTRKLVLNIMLNDKKENLYFDYKDHDSFKYIMPEKSLDIANSITSAHLTISGMIRELSMLKDDGIITIEEFEEKKKQLLTRL